jgi:hypothetical protein
MPDLISPDKAGTMTADALANLEAKLGAEAAKLSTELQVGDRGVGNSRSKSIDQQNFDGELGSNHDPLGSERLTEADISYLEKMGIPRDRIERAAKGSGVSLPAVPLDAATRELHHEVGVATSAATPSDYSFDLDRLALELPPERQAGITSTLQVWSSELKLDPLMAKGIGSYIVEQGPRLAKFDDGRRASWISQQNADLLKSCGGDKAAVAALTAKAHAVLAMSGTINGTERFSESIINSPIGNSMWLIKTLAAHSDALARVKRG